MLSVEDAQKIILAEVRLMASEAVPVVASLGRILAEDIVSPIDHPPQDTSAMDGYAVCSNDTQLASPTRPCFLTVVETIPAGAIPQKKVMPGTASRIMTGAPVPDGADAVMMQEDVTVEGEGIAIVAPVNKGEFIRCKGEVIHAGDTMLKKGTRVRSYEIAAMALAGILTCPVFRSPRVAILSTGDELVDLNTPKGPHQIYNSNGYGLAAQVTEAGGVPVMLGIAKDTRADLIQKLKQAADADFILISGGVSVGDYDFVKSALTDCSGEVTFWKVAMKPGKPLAFGALWGKPVFGLPGNPVSAMVTFELFVRPAIRKAQGSDELFRPAIYAKLMENIAKEPGRRYYVRGHLYMDNLEYCVVPTGDQDSGHLLSLTAANAFIVLPDGEGDQEAGCRVLTLKIA